MGRELPAEELRVYFPPLPPNRSLMELVNWKRVDFLQLVGTTLVFAIADRYAATTPRHAALHTVTTCAYDPTGRCSALCRNYR
mmetsp:Transcript_70676/g.193874  ORF Transcript_70676/g.193874 Transcript_70676/m.193874 type:complete len:83 (-) Transcript_70676:672-920(-)